MRPSILRKEMKVSCQPEIKLVLLLCFFILSLHVLLCYFMLPLCYVPTIFVRVHEGFLFEFFFSSIFLHVLFYAPPPMLFVSLAFIHERGNFWAAYCVQRWVASYGSVFATVCLQDLGEGANMFWSLNL